VVRDALDRKSRRCHDQRCRQDQLIAEMRVDRRLAVPVRKNRFDDFLDPVFA
jgi:hypothetical protein